MRKRKIASQIFFLLGLVIICGYKIAVQFQRPHKMVEFFAPVVYCCNDTVGAVASKRIAAGCHDITFSFIGCIT